MGIAVSSSAFFTMPGISRRRARKLRRTASALSRKSPVAAAWIVFVDTLPIEHRMPLFCWICWEPPADAPLDSLAEAFSLAFAYYPASNWTFVEFENFTEAVRLAVDMETIETWAWMRGVQKAYVSLRLALGTSAGFPLEAARGLVKGAWYPNFMLRDAWALNALGTRMLRDPRLAALSPAAREWLVEYGAHRYSDIRDPMLLLEALCELDAESIDEIVQGLPAWQLSNLDEHSACQTITRFRQLSVAERRGLVRSVRFAGVLKPEHRPALIAIPGSALRRIGKARINEQSRDDAETALKWMAADFGTVLLAGLERYPELLFECGARLYIFGETRARLLIRDLRRSPLFDPPKLLKDDPQALVVLDRLLCKERSSANRLPAFSTWDRHFAGEKILGQTAIEEVGTQLLEGLAFIQLRYIRGKIDEVLAMCGDAHAGIFRAGLVQGRKPLTRFLRSYQRGIDSRHDHVANRSWLSKNPSFAESTWLNPLQITLPVTGIGDVTIAAEQDPLEILRIGTYAKSCLAPGCVNSSNAVAVLLDINKHVLFARDATGRFLARQIVAISKDGTLFCHRVYPESASPDLQDFFQLYTEDWALQLQVSLAQKEQPIESLVIQRWYEDGLWPRYATAERREIGL